MQLTVHKMSASKPMQTSSTPSSPLAFHRQNNENMYGLRHFVTIGSTTRASLKKYLLDEYTHFGLFCSRTGALRKSSLPNTVVQLPQLYSFRSYTLKPDIIKILVHHTYLNEFRLIDSTFRGLIKMMQVFRRLRQKPRTP